MSFLRLKSVIWYCKRYTERIYVRAEDHWTMWGFLRRTSEYMIEDDSVLTYSQALDLATRVWAFAKWVAEKNNLADEAALERMCLSDAHYKHFGDEEKWLVYEMGELAGYLDGRGEMQRDHLCSLLSLMTYTVADAIEREAPEFFYPERVLTRYCKDHLDSHDDESRAKMCWNELDDILSNNKWLSEEQAIGFAVESWRVAQTALRANVDELEEIAIKPTLITDHYLSQNDVQRLMDPTDEFLYCIRFGPNKEKCASFLAQSMRVCANSLLLTNPEMFRNEKVVNND